MKKLVIALIAAALLIPLGMWWFSPEQVVMRRTKHLMEVLSLSEGTGRPLRQAKVFSMNALLAPEVELVIPAVSAFKGTDKIQGISLSSGALWVAWFHAQGEMVGGMGG